MNALSKAGGAVRNLWRLASGFVGSLLESLLIWRRGLALVMMAAPLIALVYSGLVLTLSLLPILQVWLSKLVVDGLAIAVGGISGTTATVVVLAVLYALTLIVPACLDPIQRMLSIWLEDRAVAEVDRRLMEAGTRLADLVRIEQPAFQDELRLIQEAVYFLPRLFTFLRDGLGAALTLGGLLFLLAGLHPLLPLILAILSAPHLFSEQRLQKLKYEAMARHSRAAREMDYCARITTEPVAAKEVRVFGLGDFFLGRFRARFEAAFSEISRIRLAHLRLSALFTGLHALALGGGFWYVAVQAGSGQFTLGDIALYLNAVAQAQHLILNLLFWFGFQYETLLHLRGLFAFLDQAKPAIALSPSGKGRQAPIELHRGIELRKVHFRYPESSGPVLEGVSALLPGGKVTALVGANGAGKSTLVKLLTRMYDPDSGEILLDGIPLLRYDLHSLRRRIAVVYQDFARFALTLRENIAIGADEPGRVDGALEEAARWAGADVVAAKLPQGYETQLTRRFAGGVELSGGEWQKLALARSFIRDAALVILDEPTAALDAEAEYRLFAHFSQLMAGKTALLISHRFSTVRMADHILMLEGGRIVETGSHAELIALGGRYATLYKMQAERYQEAS